MKQRKTIPTLLFLFLFGSLGSTGQGIMDDDYLVKIWDKTFETCGYANPHGNTIIPLGKYSICFTDTFRTYAIVTIPEKGFISIDRKETMLYEVFPFDNGPDYPCEGLFRIIENNKIGFADEITGDVMITPQFDCAWPFENGYAEVSNDCWTQPEGEHSTWVSDSWFSIDKSGAKALPVYLEINDPVYLAIKMRIGADMRLRSDTTSEESRFFAAKLKGLSQERQQEFETVFITSINEYTSQAHFNIGTFMLNFNDLGRMDSLEIANEFDFRVQVLCNDTFAGEFWEKERHDWPPIVMALLYVQDKDGIITFLDPFQSIIDFLQIETAPGHDD
ncbi:MAG: WG repeat-containing protein [Bacteroidales bacterium]|nr:WG repeat-containing protein [Bacteroidales bacterium]